MRTQRVNVLRFVDYLWSPLNILLCFLKTHFKIRKNFLESKRIKLILTRVGCYAKKKKKRKSVGRKAEKVEGLEFLAEEEGLAKQMFSEKKICEKPGQWVIWKTKKEIFKGESEQ